MPLRDQQTEPPPASPAIVINDRNGGNDIRIDVRDGQLVVAQGTTEKVIPIRDVIPRGIVDLGEAVLGTLAVIIVGLPLARALARRIDRRTVQPPAVHALGPEAAARLDALERNLDTVAIEVEKLSEAQRFTNRLLEARSVAAPEPVTPPSAP